MTASRGGQASRFPGTEPSCELGWRPPCTRGAVLVAETVSGGAGRVRTARGCTGQFREAAAPCPGACGATNLSHRSHTIAYCTPVLHLECPHFVHILPTRMHRRGEMLIVHAYCPCAAWHQKLRRAARKRTLTWCRMDDTCMRRSRCCDARTCRWSVWLTPRAPRNRRDVRCGLRLFLAPRACRLSC